MPKYLAVLVVASFGIAVSAYGASPLSFSGYYKNLLIDSKTVFPLERPYTLDLNRLRLELTGALTEALALDLQYDNEVLFGSYLRTEQFQIRKEQAPVQYWKLESTYADSSSYYAHHRLYRGAVTFSAGDADLHLGRQRIAWGTGRFWSPLDILNPFSPVQIEREERVGVDAALFEYKLGALTRLGVVYAPQHTSGQSSSAFLWHDNRAGVDYSIIAGRFARERIAGTDVATQLGEAGLRAEFVQTQRDDGKQYARVLLGVDYAFANTLTLSGELYYNGAGAADRSAYDFAALFSGKIQNVGRKYIGAYGSYELTPLFKWTNYLVINLGDRSSFFSPSFNYSLRSNLDLTFGAQWFRGATGAEYGRFNDAYYAQVQWFF